MGMFIFNVLRFLLLIDLNFILKQADPDFEWEGYLKQLLAVFEAVGTETPGIME